MILTVFGKIHTQTFASKSNHSSKVILNGNKIAQKRKKFYTNNNRVITYAQIL